MDEIDVEKIMSAIRQEIKEKGYTSDMLSFRDLNSDVIEKVDYCEGDFRNIVNNMASIRYVTCEIENNGSGIKKYIKRIIHKVVSIGLTPFADKQNVFNQQVANGFIQLLGFIDNQNTIISEQKKKIDTLEKKIIEMEH